MAIKKDKVDVVMVGLGWTGSIMGMELTEAGRSEEHTSELQSRM